MSNLLKNVEFLYFLVINWLTNMKITSKFNKNKILVNDLINYILDCKKNKIKKAKKNQLTKTDDNLSAELEKVRSICEKLQRSQSL